MCEDKEVLVFEIELKMLKKVFEKSSDLVKAQSWPEFCKIGGGIRNFEHEHSTAVRALEEWYRDGESDFT